MENRKTNHRRKYIAAALLLLMLISSGVGAELQGRQGLDSHSTPHTAASSETPRKEVQQTAVVTIEEALIPLAAEAPVMDETACAVSALPAVSKLMQAMPASAAEPAAEAGAPVVTDILEEEVPLAEAFPAAVEEVEEAIAVLDEVRQAEDDASDADHSAAQAEAAREAAREVLIQAKAQEMAAKEALKEAELKASQTEAQLAKAQAAKEATAQELAQAEQAVQEAKQAAQEAAQAAREAEQAAQEAAQQADSASAQAEELRQAAENAKAAADELKNSTKVYDAIATLEKSITDSKLNDLSQEMKGKDYFDWTNSLNSTGKNYAGAVNEYLESSGVLAEDDGYTYRIYHCDGKAEDGYNIFFVLETVSDKDVGTKVEQVVKYNTETGTYMVGNTVVAKDPDQNNVLNGGAPYTGNAQDITSSVQALLDQAAQARAAAEKAEADALAAESEKAAADKIMAEKEAEAERAKAEQAEADQQLEESIKGLSQAQTADQQAQAELETAESQNSAAAEAVEEAQSQLGEAFDALVDAAEGAEAAGVPEEEINEIVNAGETAEETEHAEEPAEESTSTEASEEPQASETTSVEGTDSGTSVEA